MRYKCSHIIFLLIIPLYLLRPSLPYIEYVLHKEYIVKNLCVEKNNPENNCHGKCYLNKQIKKQIEPPDANTDNNNKYFQDKKLDDHLKGKLILPQLFENETILLCYYFIPSTARFISNIFVPPKN